MTVAESFERRERKGWALVALVVLVVGATVGVNGCRDDAPPPQPPAEGETSSVPNTSVTPSDAIAAAPENPFDLPKPALPPNLPVQRRIEEAGVTLAGSQELANVINQSQIRSVAPDELGGPSAEALRLARESGVALGSRVIDITPPAPYDHGQYLPADLQLVLPLTAEQCDGATARNVGAVYLSDQGPVYFDGYYDESRSAVVVHVPHLSGFLSFRRDPMQEITAAIAAEASRRAWGSVDEARKQLEENLVKSAEEYLEKQAFDKLDGGIKRRILAGLVTHREDLGNLFSASGAQDPAGFCQAFQLLMGKIIVDNVPASGLRSILETVTDSPDTIAAVSQAGGQAAGGDYWAAVEILGRAYSESTFIYQATVQAAAIMDAGWSMLKDDALETFYQEYKAGTYVPERVSTREDILMYLKRKFPKSGGKTMTDAEVVEFVEGNFARRQAHEEAAAEWEAKLKKLHEWYADHPLIGSAIEKRFNEANRADRFRRFVRILDIIDGRLVRLGIRRSPWSNDGSFLPQREALDLINAFRDGGSAGFNRTIKEIERRLAHPLDLAGYTGYWILEDSNQEVLSKRHPSSDDFCRLDAEAERTGPHTYAGSVKLSDTFTKHVEGQEEAQDVPYSYEADGAIVFDAPPSVVPNGTNWDVMLRITLKESCSIDWAEAAEAIAGRLGAVQQPATEGAQPRHVTCYASVIKGTANRMRVRTEDDLAPSGPTTFSAADGTPWTQPASVRFTLIPETTVSTTEQCILIFEARTPAGAFREQHTYRWVKELPEAMESDLHRQISRANFKGVRSGKPDMSDAVAAKSAEPPAPVQTAAGSNVRITQLRYVPQPIIVMKEAAFEVTVENSPHVPSFAWSFGQDSPTRTDSWTSVPQCKFTYFKTGTFTLTVKLRDKNNYTRGDLAVGSWQVTVVREGDQSVAAPATTQQDTSSDAAKAQEDASVQLRLTYPAGQSPKVFTSGWVFGAECLVKPAEGESRDLSDTVKWSGSGTFTPATGPRSRPVFAAPGANTITLTVEVDGKPTTKTFKVEAVSPDKYACVGGVAYCPADSHGCVSCPHEVRGPIRTGSALVTIAGKPAARVGDTGRHAACCGPNTFEITGGDDQVLIDGRPAAWFGSATKHCGGTGTIIDVGH